MKYTFKNSKTIDCKKIESLDNFNLIIISFSKGESLYTLDGEQISKKFERIFCSNPQGFSGNENDYLTVEFVDIKYNIQECSLYHKSDLLLHIKGNIEINFLSLNPNDRYVCLRNRSHRSECIYDMKLKKEITPEVNSIYPSPLFPSVPYYKISSFDKSGLHYEIIKWPENKSIIQSSGSMDISSVDKGILNNKGPFFFLTGGSNGNQYYYLDGDDPVFIDEGERADKVFEELNKKLSKTSIIKRYFRIKS